MPREKRVKVYIDKHMQFWRELRKRCNAQIDHFTKTWSMESMGNIHDTMKLLFATYFDILRKLESEHKLSLQDIYTAHSFNKASQKSVYSDIGRVKWYFIRRGVDCWYEKTTHSATHQATIEATKTLIPIDFDKNTLDKAQAKMKITDKGTKERNINSFKIPKTVHGARQKAAWVRAVLKKQKFDEVSGHKQQNTHKRRIELVFYGLSAGALNYLPKSLREITFDENCDSSHVGLG